jgi:soluble lytic murein transglycosylase-like protein
MVIAMCRRWCAVTCLSLSAIASGLPAQAGPACEAQLSRAQRHRFTLAVEACATHSARAAQGASHADRQADALIATGRPEPRRSDVLAPSESAHLQLFAQRGVVAAEVGQAAQEWPAPLQPRGGRPGVAASPVAPKGSASGQPLKQAFKQPLRAVSLAPAIDAVARKHDIDPLLLHAIAHVESRHDPAARSHAGALGVMQVMPATARRFGVAEKHALHVPDTNLEVSAAYLKTLQRRFGLDLPLVLAAYNAGEGAVERYGRRIPPYRETRDYVQRVLQQYGVLQRYRGLGSTAAGPPAAGPAAAQAAVQAAL